MQQRQECPAPVPEGSFSQPSDPYCVETITALARAAGSLKAALLLLAAIDRQRCAGPGNPFTWPQLEIAAETSLTRRSQITARGKLESSGLVIVMPAGDGKPLLWRVDMEKIKELEPARFAQGVPSQPARFAHGNPRDIARVNAQPARFDQGNPRDLEGVEKAPNVSPTGMVVQEQEPPAGRHAGTHTGTREAPTHPPDKTPPLPPLPPDIPSDFFEELLAFGVVRPLLLASFKRHGSARVRAYFDRVKALRRAGRCSNPAAMLTKFLREGATIPADTLSKWDAAIAAEPDPDRKPRGETIAEGALKIDELREEIRRRNEAAEAVMRDRYRSKAVSAGVRPALIPSEVRA